MFVNKDEQDGGVNYCLLKTVFPVARIVVAFIIGMSASITTAIGSASGNSKGTAIVFVFN